MVGNGCIGSKKGICSGREDIEVNFLYGHGLFSAATYKEITDNCDFMSNTQDGLRGQSNDEKCNEGLLKMGKEVGGVSVYDIYGNCSDEDFTAASRAPTFLTTKFAGLLNSMAEVEVDGAVAQSGPVGCIDDIAARFYLNQDEVKKAIHVTESTSGEWRVCTGAINYKSTVEDETVTHYPDLIDNYRVLIFNGDTDACVPYTDNDEWTSGMGFDVEESWRPWLVNDQPAGYITTYDTKGDGSFAFMTVKGSGHMVPQIKPEQAFAMYERFLKNEKM